MWFLLWAGLLHAESPSALNLATLTPDSLSLPHGNAIEEGTKIPVDGPWRLVGSSYGIRSYEAPSPIRTRALFFYSAPDKMQLFEGERPLLYGADYADADRAGTWAASTDSITVRLRPDSPAPEAGMYSLSYPKAIERERALHVDTAGLGDVEFVRQGFQVGERTREGLYLPAPSEISWNLVIPENGHLKADIGIIPPEVEEGGDIFGGTGEVYAGGGGFIEVGRKIRTTEHSHGGRKSHRRLCSNSGTHSIYSSKRP
jgi:hypothetical protein